MEASAIGADDEDPTTEFGDGTTVDDFWFRWPVVEAIRWEIVMARFFWCGFASWKSGEGRWLLG